MNDRLNHSGYEKLTQQISAIGSDIKSLRLDFEAHYKEDAEWKLEAAPILSMGRNVQGFSAVLKWIIYFIVSTATVVGSLYTGIQWLKR